MLTPSTDLTTMIDAARVAGQGLLRHFRARGDLEVRLKGPADFVSTADLESEQRLRAILLGAHPSYGLLAEESEAKSAVDPARARFIVDPLDGTTNFLHGIPHFAVAI